MGNGFGLSLRNERRRANGDISIDKMDVWGAIVACGLYVEFSDG